MWFKPLTILHIHVRTLCIVGGGDANSPMKVGVAGIASRLRPLPDNANEAECSERLQNKCSHLQSQLEKVIYVTHFNCEYCTILLSDLGLCSGRAITRSSFQVRRQLATEREEFHVKECKMEASLNTAHKTNQELEVCTSSSLSVPHYDRYMYCISLYRGALRH